MKRKLTCGAEAQIEGANNYNPSRGTTLLQSLIAAISAIQGRTLKLEEIAAYAGCPNTTMFDWLNGAKLRQVECVLRLAECLPELKRAVAFNENCRELPRLSHRRLAWHEVQSTCLERIIGQENGLTVVQGDEEARDFLITALGHSPRRPTKLGVCGIDVRLPARFVPVVGVTYLNQPLQQDLVKMYTIKIWPSVRQLENQFVLLNKIWLATPELHNDIWELANRCHVIMADDLRFTPAQLKGKISAPTHLLTATQSEDRRIKVTIQPA